jgi:uncharacterized protein YoaH (UPF0181 family)
MDIDAAKEVLEIYIENGSRILRAGFGVNMAESSFFDVVLLLRHEPALRGLFIDKVRTAFEIRDLGDLAEGMVPKELIELVAHELRWDEFRSLADERIQKLFAGNRRLAIGDIASTIFDAYSDDWPDREFYERYRRAPSC